MHRMTNVKLMLHYHWHINAAFYPVTLTTHEFRNLACKLENINLLIFFWIKNVKFKSHKALYELFILTMFILTSLFRIALLKTDFGNNVEM
jgi:hypothetical protein